MFSKVALRTVLYHKPVVYLCQYYSYFNKELRQVFFALTRVSAEKVFHSYLK